MASLTEELENAFSTNAADGDAAAAKLATAIEAADIVFAGAITIPAVVAIAGGGEIRFGTTVPGSGDGSNGDIFVSLATTGGTLYRKESGSWVQKV